MTPSRVGVTVPFRFDTTYIGTLVFRAAVWLDGFRLLGLAGKPKAGARSRESWARCFRCQWKRDPRRACTVNDVRFVQL